MMRCCSSNKDQKTFKAKLKTTGKWSVLALLTVLATSCDIPEDDAADKLVEASGEELDKVIVDEISQANLLNFKVGQYLHYEMNYRVEMGPVAKLQDVLREVKSVAQNGQDLEVILKEDKYQWSAGGDLTDEKHSDVIWQLKLGEDFQSNSATYTVKAVVADVLAKSGEEPPTPPVITYEYYNLRYRSVLIPAPPLMAARPNCGGLENCRLRGTEVAFVIKVKKDGNELFTAQQKVVLSRDVLPLFLFDEGDDYILPVYSDCIAGLIEVKYFVTQCTVLRDMKLIP